MQPRAALSAVWLALAVAAGVAAELPPDLRGLFEHFQSHRRIALGYLRTQNSDLGAVEIERLRDGLAADRNAMSPRARSDLSFAAAVARAESQVADALRAADGGDIDRARGLLEESARPLTAWRQANGIRLFSDCIAEIGNAYAPLDSHRLGPPDLADPVTVARIVASTGAVIAALDRCEQEAGAMRGEPEFRRLFDGMRASLAQMPGAVAARDGALLHRLLIEQRSFEQLLSFRFG